MNILKTVGLTIATVFWATASNAAPPSFQGLGDLPGGGTLSRAYGVSADGQIVVGESQSASGLDTEAFRWTQATGIMGLGDLPGSNENLYGRGSRARAVSADGYVIVGDGSSPTAWPIEATRWTTSNGLIGLGGIANALALNSDANAVSQDGSFIVGGSNSPFGPGEAFIWTAANGVVGLGDLPGGDFASDGRGVSRDGTVVVGRGWSASGPEAFRWTQQDGMIGLGDLPGGDFYSAASAVSGDGNVIIGWSASLPSFLDAGEAYRWTEATGMVPLGDFDGGPRSSIAFATNFDGSVIVGEGDSIGGTGGIAFIWTADRGMRKVEDVLEESGLSSTLAGWTLLSATGVSDDGETFVGFGINPSGQTEAWIATIPEPSTWVLAFIGIGMLGVRKVRRKD